MSTKHAPKLRTTVAPGGERLEVRVQWVDPTFRPYCWEIIDEDSGSVVTTSADRFRKPGEAFQAGFTALRRKTSINGSPSTA